MSDERQNLPSASGLERLVLCPGSWNLEKDLPEPEQSEDAEQGQVIHEFLAHGPEHHGEYHDDLLPYEALAAQLVETYIGLFTGSIESEKRLWLRDRNGNSLFSGKFDRLYVQEKTGIALDWKSGRSEVTSAEGNWQLRALAVLVAIEFGLDEVIVAIVQPHVSPQTSVCRYGVNDLRIAATQIREALILAGFPDARRIPGPKQCQYCKAKAICPEARGTVTDLILRPSLEVSNDQLSMLLDRCILAADVIDAIRAEGKKRLEAGQEVPGWHLKPGRINRPIVKIEELFSRMAGKGVSASEFIAVCSAGKEKVKELLRAKTNLKGKELDEAFETLLDNLTEERRSGVMMERVKVNL